MVISMANQPNLDINVNTIRAAFVAVGARMDSKNRIGNRIRKISRLNANVSFSDHSSQVLKLEIGRPLCRARPLNSYILYYIQYYSMQL